MSFNSVNKKVHPVVVEQDLIEDFRKLDRATRRSLAEGPTVHILLDGKKLFHGMPKRAFMAMCKEGQDAIAANPKAEAVSYKSDQIQRKALFRIFDYMKGNCFTAKPFVLKPDSNMLDSLELYRAGRLFFKSDQCLQGLFHHIHRYLEDGTMPSFGELEVICKLKDAFNHKVYNFAVAVMATIYSKA
ncbi:hypothetical protein K491DRAFT_716526 [Lophiostoma macrostomum CBS 122681]|uniref:BTB domain-containing protein n=1 Tax=Lophiostoma macrostomum CBS 122681 TaxID=1314788 RepID=A0A6A6T888_9PLEO|nr:hypothetical protein K491DRAFT_716526 [Lophiostoma macrostomum CBS 122681]